MISSSQKFFVSAPLYYVNAAPHLGHLYSSLFADFLARYQRMNEKKVIFVMGCDQNGQKIYEAAKKQNQKVENFVATNTEMFLKLWKKANISYTHFIKTSKPNHKEFVQQQFQKLLINKSVVLKNYQGNYCIPCENFQKVSNGTSCLICSRPLTQVTEPNYFLQIDATAEQTLKTLISQWRIEKKTFSNQLQDFFNSSGNKDFSISRQNQTWGINLNSAKDQTAYVWFDALLGYASALSPEERKNIWENADCEIIQVIGKEIMKFHMIYWPVILKNIGYRQPSSFLVHGWILQDNEKMSKSRGNLIDPFTILQNFDLDVLRMYLCSFMNPEKDVKFNENDLQEFHNSFIVDNFSNFHFRVLSMCKKYSINLNSKIISNKFSFNKFFANSINKYHLAWKQKNFAQIFQNINSFIKYGNKMINKTEPWNIYKNKEYPQLFLLLQEWLNMLKVIADFCKPITPSLTDKIYLSLNLSEKNYKPYQAIDFLPHLKNLPNPNHLYEKLSK